MPINKICTNFYSMIYQLYAIGNFVKIIFSSNAKIHDRNFIAAITQIRVQIWFSILAYFNLHTGNVSS